MLNLKIIRYPYYIIKNKKLKYCILILFCCINFIAFSSNDTINKKFNSVEVDKNLNIYATTNTGIYKYNSDLKLLYSFEYNKYGVPSSIDLHIPMKVLLYFTAYNKILVLDNRMSVVREIDLDKISTEFNNVICFSADNNFWVYDNNLQSLTKYNQNFNILYQYENMNIRIKQMIQAQHLYEVNNYIVLTDSIHGVYLFDMLGNYIRQIQLTQLRKFQLVDNQIYYLEDKQLKSINLFTNELKVYNTIIPDESLDVKISGTKIVVLLPNQIKVLAITETP